MLAIRDYEQAPYLVLATRNGLVKKTRLGDYNSPRQAGVIAINFREDDDELIGAELVNPDDDILLVSRKGQAIRFRAGDDQLRPMGRATSGVTGMRFKYDDDRVLSMSVIRAVQMAAEEAVGEVAVGEEAGDAEAPAPTETATDEVTTDEAGTDEAAVEAAEVKLQYVFTMTDAGYAKRTRINGYRLTGRGGLGITTMRLTNEERGGLVGAFIVEDGDEILSITQGGQVVRSPIDENFKPSVGPGDPGREVRDPEGG